MPRRLARRGTSGTPAHYRGSVSTAPAVPRTLTEMLRLWDDESLVALLRQRPDLAFPAPTTFSQLASRATTRQSVQAALAGLNAFELWVAGQVAGGADGTTAMDLTGVDQTSLQQARRRLHRLALLWGESDQLKPVRAMAVLADGPATPPPPPTPPPPGVGTQDPAQVDAVAAGSAFELVRRVEVLVESCDHFPIRLRRDGQLPTREVRRLQGLLDAAAPAARAYVELARDAGLLGPSAVRQNEVLLPTSVFDRWQPEPLAEQWGSMVRSWHAGSAAGGPSWLKTLCMQAFGDPAEGRVLSVESLRQWLSWQRPRRPVGSDRQVAEFFHQAARIGVTGLGALASYAANVDTAGLDRLLPARVDRVLVQADLTAVAPGPLTPGAAHDLGALAEVESRGGATVYRFSAGSLKEAYDRGWSTTQMLDVLRARSATSIPQPLEYLVRDLDRTDDAGGTGGSGGTDDGKVRRSGVRRRDRVRVEPAPSTSESGPADRFDPSAARAIIAGLRTSEPDDTDAVAGPEPAASAFGGGDSPLPTLREATETREVVWFGYVDSRGARGERLVVVDGVDDGRLSARDARSGELLTVPVHRITAAHIVRART